MLVLEEVVLVLEEVEVVPQVAHLLLGLLLGEEVGPEVVIHLNQMEQTNCLPTNRMMSLMQTIRRLSRL